MTVKYIIQGVSYPAQGHGYRCLNVALDVADLAEIARILMYARFRHDPAVLQFHVRHGIAEDDGNNARSIPLTLNVDERTRLYFSSADSACHFESIRFDFEELAFPWLIKHATHAICTSRRFFWEYGISEEHGWISEPKHAANHV